MTGKPCLAAGFAPATINHALSAMSVIYEYHLLTGDGPPVNPVPAQRVRDGLRALTRRSPIEPVPRLPRAAYRQRMPTRPPRALTDAVFSEFFAALPSNRDRALVALGVGSGPSASELLALRFEDLDIGRGPVALTGKGHRDPHLGAEPPAGSRVICQGPRRAGGVGPRSTRVARNRSVASATSGSR